MIKKIFKKIIKTFPSNKFTTLNRIEISKKALLYNYSFFKKINPNFSVIPVLKSNAYGHGIVQCAQILNSADCDFLAVDGYYEAEKIIDVTKHKILVMGYISPENLKILDYKKCSFVIQNIDALHKLGVMNKKINIHIELNTGMNRLGLSESELDEYLSVLKIYPNLNLEGVMTHLADADNNMTDDFTNTQVNLFDDMLEVILSLGYRPNYIHIAQTAGCLIAKSKYANSIRIGIGLYGINPLGNSDNRVQIFNDLKPAMQIKSKIIKVIELKVGERVSYNGIFTADRPMKIGVLPIGYYEGVPRELSNHGYFTSGDIKLRITGRVCMNHTMIDITNSNLAVGDEITVMGGDGAQINSIATICLRYKLFNYQIMSNITENIRRVIVD